MLMLLILILTQNKVQILTHMPKANMKTTARKEAIPRLKLPMLAVLLRLKLRIRLRLR